MSKSLGNIIDPEELITEFGADATRYLLLTQFPFGQDGDIKADKFIEQYNADLANGISNLLHRSLSMTEKYLGGIVPDRFEEPEELINAGGINTVWDDYKSALESNELGKGLEVVHRLVTISNDYIEKHKPWDLANHNLEKLKEVVYTFLEINRHISFMLHPYLPDTAEKMQEALGIQYEEHMTFDEFIKWGQLPPGTDIKKDVPLFQRING